MATILSNKIELTGKAIVDTAFTVHKELGPGLLEKIYETCFCYELQLRGIDYRRQVSIPFTYKNIEFDEGLKIDVLVEETIICELKAKEALHDIWKAQIISHLKLTGLPLGFLINFKVPLIKDGIKRFIV